MPVLILIHTRRNKLNLSDFNIFHIFSSIRHVVSSIVDINGAVINQLQTNDSFRFIIIYAFLLFCNNSSKYFDLSIGHFTVHLNILDTFELEYIPYLDDHYRFRYAVT